MSEDLFYERVNNISGISLGEFEDFVPTYGTAISFEADNLRFDTNDGYFKLIPNGINSLKAKFNLKYQTNEEGAKKLTSYYEDSEGITPLVIKTDNNIYNNITGYCTEYSINHINSQNYEFNASMEVLESPGNLNWTGLNYLNYDFKPWEANVSYKKDDIVFYDFDYNSDFIADNPTKRDLVAWWNFNQGRNSQGVNTLRFSSINGISLTPITPVSSTHIGNLFGINGFSDLLDNPQEPSPNKCYLKSEDQRLSITGAQTWSAWIKVRNNAGEQIIMSKYTTQANGRSIALRRTNSWRLRVTLSKDGRYIQGDKSITNEIETTSNKLIIQEQWYHVAMVYEPSKKLELYVDGNLEASLSGEDVLDSVHDTPAPFVIGAFDIETSIYPYGRWHFDGQIDESCIFQRALSDSEIKWLADGKYFFRELIDEKRFNHNPTNKNLVAYWGFDNDRGDGLSPGIGNLVSWWSMNFDGSNWIDENNNVDLIEKGSFGTLKQNEDFDSNINDACVSIDNWGDVFVDGDKRLSSQGETQLILSGQQTISVWFNMNELRTRPGVDMQPRFIVSRAGYSTERGFLISVTTSKQLSFSISPNGSDSGSAPGTELNRSITSRGDIVTPGKWHHVCAVFKPSQSMELYLDGELIAFSSSSVPNYISTVFKDFQIGGYADGGYGPFDGKIDEVSVFNRALDSKEVLWLSKHFYNDLGDRFQERYDDYHVNKLHLTKRNNPRYQIGKNDACYDLRNSGKLASDITNNKTAEVLYANAETLSGKLDITGAQTWCAWVYPRVTGWDDGGDANMQMGIMGKYQWTVGYRSINALYMDNNLRLRSYVDPTGGNFNGQWGLVSQSGDLKVKQWQHVAMVYEPSKRHELYVNGQLVVDKDPNQGNIAPNCHASDTPLVLGAYAAFYDNGNSDTGGLVNGREPLDGAIDECCIFDRALSPEEINWVYENPTYDGLLDVDRFSLNNYYYCTEDHTSTFENAPNFSGSGLPWTRDFHWNPDQGITNSVKFENKKHGFGYSIYDKTKRNTAIVPINYSFSNISTKELKSMLHFLESKQGYKRFKHQIPSVYNRPKVYYCDSWNHTMVYNDTHNLQVSFTEDPMGVIPKGE